MTDWFSDYPNIASLTKYQIVYDLIIDEPYPTPSSLYSFSIPSIDIQGDEINFEFSKLTSGLWGFAYISIQSVAFPNVKSKLYELNIYNPADFVYPFYSSLGDIYSIDKTRAKTGTEFTIQIIMYD